jgi:glycosyltransferase involved in cell wall biosynthesis
MHLVWIHDDATARGGAERYVHEAAVRLRAHGVRSTLLYDVRSRVEASFAEAFEGAYPLVDVEGQMRRLAPDAVYVHRMGDEQQLARVRAATAAPIVRFFHDHKLFCLREHKMTALEGRPCSAIASARHCYPCLGFVRRGSGTIPFELVSIRSLTRERAHSRDLDAYVVASSYMAEHVAAHGLARARIHVLPLSVDAPPPAQIERAREPGTILFAGALVRGKGLDVLLEAVARSRSVRELIVAGAGAQERELRETASRAGVEGRVRWAGRLGTEALEQAYRRAEVVVVPSRVPETFGLSGLEASARGIPVVASDVGGIRQWLEHGANGLLVAPNDVWALAGALDRLLVDGGLRERLGREGRRRYEARHRPEHHDEALLSLLASLRGRRAA